MNRRQLLSALPFLATAATAAVAAPKRRAVGGGFWKNPITRVGLNAADGADFPHPNYTMPTRAWFQWVRSIGINHARVTFRIEAIEPVLGGALDQIQVDRTSAMLDDAASIGVYVVLDAHNFGRRQDLNGYYLGDPRLPAEALAEFWRKMAVRFGSHPALMGYGLMNEPPFDIPGWAACCQVCIDAIRSADPRTPVLAPFRGSVLWNTGEGHYDDMATLKGNYVAIEGHQYPDRDSSGRFNYPPSSEIAYAEGFLGTGNWYKWQAALTEGWRNWLMRHNRRGYLGETGAPSTMMWLGDHWGPHPYATTPEGRYLWLEIHEYAIGVMGEAGIPTVFWLSGEHAEANTLFVGSHKSPPPNPMVEMIKRALVGKPLIN
jgi:endoglucanase